MSRCKNFGVDVEFMYILLYVFFEGGIVLVDCVFYLLYIMV